MAFPGTISQGRPVLRPLAFATLLMQLLILTACGTIMHSSTQQIGVSSAPTGAQVTVNGSQRGVTPLVMDLRRKDRQVISVNLEGYAPYEVALTRSVSGWVWGNIVFGGLIGLAVDASTGGLYKLSPEHISAQLARAGAVVDASGEMLLVTVVLEAEEGWEFVGSLGRE